MVGAPWHWSGAKLNHAGLLVVTGGRDRVRKARGVPLEGGHVRCVEACSAGDLGAKQRGESAFLSSQRPLSQAASAEKPLRPSTYRLLGGVGQEHS